MEYVIVSIATAQNCTRMWLIYLNNLKSSENLIFIITSFSFPELDLNRLDGDTVCPPLRNGQDDLPGKKKKKHMDYLMSLFSFSKLQMFCFRIFSNLFRSLLIVFHFVYPCSESSNLWFSSCSTSGSSACSYPHYFRFFQIVCPHISSTLFLHLLNHPTITPCFYT